MNRIDHGLRAELGGAPLFQTWNPHAEPEAATVKYDYSFERPVVTFDSAKAMQRLQDAQAHAAPQRIRDVHPGAVHRHRARPGSVSTGRTRNAASGEAVARGKSAMSCAVPMLP